MAELRGLEAIQNELETAGGTILAIATDEVKYAKKVHDANHLRFDVLSDAEVKTTRAYGLYMHEPMHDLDIAIPANILIGRDGKIAWMRVSESVQDRIDPDELMDVVRKHGL